MIENNINEEKGSYNYHKDISSLTEQSDLLSSE